MRYFDKKRFTLGQVVALLTTVLVGIAVIAYASSVTIPNTFTSGTTISASQMNANFTAVKTSVDDNNTRITALEQRKTKVAYSQDNTCCSNVTTPVAHQSVALYAPSNGNAIVSFAGRCGLSHTAGQYTRIQYAISTVSDDVNSSSRADIQVPSAAPTDFYVYSCSTQQVYSVSTGTTTFYLNVDNTSSGADSVNIGWVNLHAIFIPN